MRTAIVTGAAGGIGEATASDLARWGWRVFGFDLRAGESNLASSDLVGFGGSIEPIRVDVTDRAAVEAAVAAVLAATGGTLDAVVANAGVRVAGAFEETPFDEVRRLFEVNLGGAMHLTRAALPALRATEASRVVVVSSVGGLSALPGLAAYCGSKWAVEGWAESLAHELQPLGVGVALVEPASVRTGLWDLGTVHGDPDGPYASLVDAVEAGDDRAWARALDPASVSATMVGVVEGRRGLRHPVGLTARARFAARGLVPSGLQRRVIGRLTGQPPPLASPRNPEGVVMVTGCSSGFGLGITVELARRGHRVAATMRDLARRGSLDAALSEAGVADRVEILQMDVTDRASIAEAFARADRWVQLAGDVGRIVGLVNNAGVASVGPFEELPSVEVGRVIETNLLGTLAVTHAALPRMRPHGGRIVFISSSSGLGGLPTWSAYAASKWGVEGFAESLAFEVGPHGIDLALVEPGAFPTGIWRDDSWHGDPDGPYATLARAMADADRKAVEAGGDPAVVARTVAACLSGGRPVIRHPVGRGAWLRWAARGVVPFGVQRRIVARLLA
ncbi:MAG: SDR family NAD(P)-dependent oxidoreductase [Acidimicrobiales bacterium]|nr:SDR family NAD(P)-dependent oxidoreductase [Acidimicrobiales bacterium]